ncbi:hypothetical protein DV515_00011215 [Chloebia gouldiae]|uniref:Uncharacterized protein n=1 Tax=Chloebia gouldiae TaxID=44316 RepID=A0A3L8S736_CHLGU|nr:hypothetical protein DV515_00011215 [Chloebia gouldiae]
MLLCNMESDPSSHQDVRLLSRLFPVVGHDRTGENPDLSLNQSEKEKQDYVFCLEQSLLVYNPEYILLMEDDAGSLSPTLEVEPYLYLSRDLLYFKLYRLEGLQHYFNPEPTRILEWLGLGMFLGPVLSCAYCQAAGRAGPIWCLVVFFALYSTALLELVGQHCRLELCHLHPPLYNVGFAKDTVLYLLLWGKGENTFVVEPKLVQHMGMYSSLRLNSDPKLL